MRFMLVLESANKTLPGRLERLSVIRGSFEEKTLVESGA
jgi:hypothetical protein